MFSDEAIIAQTRKWVNEVVIGLNFCPFAAKVVNAGTVRFRVEPSAVEQTCLNSLLAELEKLNHEKTISTTLLILPNATPLFSRYLQLLNRAEKLLKKKGYTGIYQLASFHPEYVFAGVAETDAANFTNRSPFPMLHLLREESLTEALRFYPNPENIPVRNKQLAREKGGLQMKLLREACMQ